MKVATVSFEHFSTHPNQQRDGLLPQPLSSCFTCTWTRLPADVSGNEPSYSQGGTRLNPRERRKSSYAPFVCCCKRQEIIIESSEAFQVNSVGMESLSGNEPRSSQGGTRLDPRERRKSSYASLFVVARGKKS